MAAPAPFKLEDYKKRMDGALTALQHEFGGLRTGRASPQLLDPIKVEAYGAESPLTSVASVTVPEPRMISVNVWDKAVVPAVDKAIRQANLGLNPIVDGQTLRIPIPPLTGERRQELAKVAGKYAEQQRVAVRNIRRDAIHDIRELVKEKEVAEDEGHRAEEAIQKLTDKRIAEIDKLLAAKEADLMAI